MNNSRVVLAVGLALLGGLFAFLIQRSIDTAPVPTADRKTPYLDADLVGRLPNRSTPDPSPSPRANAARAPRPAGEQATPEPVVGDPPSIENLPAAPEVPEQADPGACGDVEGLPGLSGTCE
ncbi:MAG: hypothetical protein WD646_02690 [Actinomycetota bacterium]